MGWSETVSVNIEHFMKSSCWFVQPGLRSSAAEFFEDVVFVIREAACQP